MKSGTGGAFGGTAAGASGAAAVAGAQNTISVDWQLVEAHDPQEPDRILGFSWLFATARDTLLGTRNQRLYRSVYRGQTWALLPQGSGPSSSGGGLALFARLQLPGGRIFATQASAWSDGPASSAADLYRSDDDGLTWMLCNGTAEPLSSASVAKSAYSIVSMGARDLALATGSAVLVSRDAGEHFTRYSIGFGGYASVAVDRYGTLQLLANSSPRSRVLRMRGDSGFWFDTANEDTMFGSQMSLLGMKDGSLLAISPFARDMVRSLDFGQTWVALPNTPATFMALERPKGSLLSLGELELALSSDYGANWQALSLPASNVVEWQAMAQLSDGSVLVSGRVSGLMDDFNRMFVTNAIPDPTARASSPAPERPATCYDGQLSSGEERTDCGGICGICEDWGLRERRTWDCLFITPQGTVLGASAGASLRSTDGGRTWTTTDATSSYCNYAVGSDGLYAVATNSSKQNSLVLSKDDGVTFASVPEAALPASASSFRVDAAGAFYCLAGDALRSSDRGRTWQTLEPAVNLAAGALLAVDPLGAVLLYDRGHLSRLSADGTSFDWVDWPAGLSIGGQDKLFVAGASLYVTDSTELYRVDPGLTSAVSLGSFQGDVQAIGDDGHGNLVVWTGGGVRASKDNGVTWNDRSSGLPYMLLGVTWVGFLPSGEAVVRLSSEWITSRPMVNW